MYMLRERQRERERERETEKEEEGERERERREKGPSVVRPADPALSRGPVSALSFKKLIAYSPSMIHFWGFRI